MCNNCQQNKTFIWRVCINISVCIYMYVCVCLCVLWWKWWCLGYILLTFRIILIYDIDSHVFQIDTYFCRRFLEDETFLCIYFGANFSNIVELLAKWLSVNYPCQVKDDKDIRLTSS